VCCLMGKGCITVYIPEDEAGLLDPGEKELLKHHFHQKKSNKLLPKLINQFFTEFARNTTDEVANYLLGPIVSINCKLSNSTQHKHVCAAELRRLRVWIHFLSLYQDFQMVLENEGDQSIIGHSTITWWGFGVLMEYIYPKKNHLYLTPVYHV
ncbi:hypothetical protein MKX01_025575, partial [Papaver californicum]